MTSNHKLTSLLAGRTIVGSSGAAGVLSISFSNGSVMTVNVAGASDFIVGHGTVDKVRQEGLVLALDFVDGSSVEITTAEETSSVMVRDGSGAMEYAD